MGRNPRKYAYPQPCFDLSSEVWQKLVEDARYMGKPIADMIVLRMGDFYKGRWDEIPVKQEVASPVALPQDASKNALAAAQAWIDDDDDIPTVPRLPAM